MTLAGGSIQLGNNYILGWIFGPLLVLGCVLAVVGYYAQKLQWWRQDRREKKQFEGEDQRDIDQAPGT